jgi:hypothetical protein
MNDPTRPELAAMIAAARNAVDSFRDFARVHSMDFKHRDKLVMAIHKAIDVADISFVPPAPADAVTDETCPRCGLIFASGGNANE